MQIILFLAGIQKIPQSLYESARVDSATEWEMLWKITLPMLSPIILLNIVYTAIALFAQDSPMIDYITTTAFKTSYGTLSGFAIRVGDGLGIFPLYIPGGAVWPSWSCGRLSSARRRKRRGVA